MLLPKLLSRQNKRLSSLKNRDDSLIRQAYRGTTRIAAQPPMPPLKSSLTRSARHGSSPRGSGDGPQALCTDTFQPRVPSLSCGKAACFFPSQPFPYQISASSLTLRNYRPKTRRCQADNSRFFLSPSRISRILKRGSYCGLPEATGSLSSCARSSMSAAAGTQMGG